MNETGYTCPECGNKESFTADGWVQSCQVLIDPEGWTDNHLYHTDLPDWATIECDVCDHTAPWYEFDDNYTEYENKELAAFVHNQLESCIGSTGKDVAGLLYEENGDSQVVRIRFRNGYEKRANITGDNEWSAMKDVIEAVVS